jgi:hypothetical protein
VPTIVILTKHVERLFGQQVRELPHQKDELVRIAVGLGRESPRRGDDQDRGDVMDWPPIEKRAEFTIDPFVFSFDHRPTGTSR